LDDAGVEGVSLCVVTTEHGGPLRATLRSIIAQTERPLEVVVVSVAAGGESMEAAVGSREVSDAFKLRGWQWISNPNSSPPKARALALRAAIGTSMLLVDGSSYLEPDALELMAAASARGGGAVVTSLGHFYAGEMPEEGAGRATMPQAQFTLFLGRAMALGAFRNAFGGPVVLLPRRVARAVHAYEGALLPGYDHWEVLAAAGAAGAPHELVPRALFFARPMGGMRRARREDENVLHAIHRPYLSRLPVELRSAVATAGKEGVPAVLGIVGPMGSAPPRP